MRPKSIVYYEYAYLGSVLLNAVQTAMTWREAINSAQAKDVRAMLGDSFMSLSVVFVFTALLVLWYFTARSASLIAKWIVVVLLAISVIGFVLTRLPVLPALGLPGIVVAVATLLKAVAIWMLFRPDARAWFGEKA